MAKKSNIGFHWSTPAMILGVIFVITKLFFIFSKPYIEGFETKPTLEYYYMDSCGFCNSFNPEWKKLNVRVQQEKLNVVLHKINMKSKEENDKKKVDKNKVNAAPTIILQKGSESLEYTGDRTVDAIIEFLKKNL